MHVHLGLPLELEEDVLVAVERRLGSFALATGVVLENTRGE